MLECFWDLSVVEGLRIWAKALTMCIHQMVLRTHQGTTVLAQVQTSDCHMVAYSICDNVITCMC